MSEPQLPVSRDIVVVGASAGGVEALRALVSLLPPTLEAAVFVVLHVAATGKSLLPAILDRIGNLPAAHAVDGEEIERGRIYVAPPDHHLVVTDRVELTRSPRENGHRPAIDSLFRSAAASHGRRVTGVVLSGTLDDGADGLRLVRQAGGATLVQRPDEAMFGAMPRAAIAYAQPDAVLSVHEIGQEIVRLAREPSLQEVTMSNPGPRRAAQQVAEQTSEDPRPGARSAYACPDCGGALWEVESNGLLRFRCRIGHAYSEASMLDRQSHALENALWTSLRVLEERAALCRRLSARLEQRGSGATANSFVHQAEEAERVAVQLKLLLESPDLLRLPDPVSDQG